MAFPSGQYFFHDKSVHFNVSIVNGWTDAPVGLVEKKAEFIRTTAFFSFTLDYQFFLVQIPEKKYPIANGQQLCYW